MGLAVVKDIGGVAGLVTGEAGCIAVGVAVHPGVVIVGFRVYVAIGTTEFGKVRGVRVAVLAKGPGAFMLSTINREIGSIMVGKLRRHPVGVGGMAVGAGLGES